jgi:ferredoxin, 2Fe-2S
LDVCLNFGIQLEHACDDEADRLDMAAGLTLRSRLGCQCIVEGDVEVEIPSWNRNYVTKAAAP